MDRQLRVLIVEDDPHFAYALGRRLAHAAMLQGVALEVDVASTLSQAQHAKRFDLGLVDRGLPDGDGLRLVSALRETHRFRETPLMLMSAGSIDEISAECWAMQVHAVHKTPLDKFVAGALAAIVRLAGQPYDWEDECRAFLTLLSDEAQVRGARREIFVDRVLGRSSREIASRRGSSPSTVETQSKGLVSAVREAGIEIYEDGLVPSILRAILDARYRDR